MPLNSVMLSIGILFASFLGGILFYYVVDHNDKQHKKYELDQFLNVLIQFILYLWLMKIIAQFSMVFQDPMSVLAHPANSMHFLFASIILLVHLWFKYRNNTSATINLFQTGSFIIIASLFIYEILQLLTQPGADFNVMIVVLAALIVTNVLLYGKHNELILSGSLIGVFLIVACGFAFFKGYYMFFGFMLSPYYFLLLIILLAIYLYYMVYKNKLHESTT